MIEDFIETVLKKGFYITFLVACRTWGCMPRTNQIECGI